MPDVNVKDKIATLEMLKKVDDHNLVKDFSELPGATILPSDSLIAIEINGTTYKIAGSNLATALKALGNYLATTGGTMTGAITSKMGSYDLTMSNNGVTAQTWPSPLQLQDSNGKLSNLFGGLIEPNGRVQTRIVASNWDSGGTQHTNSLLVGIDKSGNPSYTVSDPAAFRSAIGVPASPALYSFTAASNVSITRNNSFVIGKYIVVSVLIQTSAAISGTSTNLFTLASGDTATRAADLTALAMNGSNQYPLYANSSAIRINMSSGSMPAGYYHVVGNIALS